MIRDDAGISVLQAHPVGIVDEPDAALEVMKTYVAGQAALGYSTFDPGPRADDVMLVSFPKSGSTWMSYLLHQLRSGGDDAFRDIKDEVIDITPGHWNPEENPFLIKQRFRPRTFKTHGRYSWCPKGAKDDLRGSGPRRPGGQPLPVL